MYGRRWVDDHFASYLTNLKDANALAAWYEGADSLLSFNQVYEYGVRKRMPVYSIFYGSFTEGFVLNELRKGAADACIGEITSAIYSPFIDTDVNKKFVADFRQKRGKTPDASDVDSYDAANILLHALQATGGDTTPEKLRKAILQVDFMGVEGRVRFDQATRCRIRDIYVCKAPPPGK